MKEGVFSQGRPAVGRKRRRILWIGLLVVPLALCILVWRIPGREPRYLGKTRSEWFPYLWDISKGSLPGARLTNGVPESFPVLWSALQAEPPAWAGLYHAIPATLQAMLRLPQSAGIPFIRLEASRALLRSSSSPPFAARVVALWRELNEPVRQLLILILATEGRMQPAVEGIATNLRPLLIEALTDKDPELQALAAYTLLRVPGLSEGELRQVARLGLQISSRAVSASDYWNRLTLYRGSGVAGRRCLADVVSDGHAVVEDRFQLVLCLLDPERFPPAQYWESTGDLRRDRIRRQAVGELIDYSLQDEPLDELAAWFGKYLVSDLESPTHPRQAADLNLGLDSDRAMLLVKLSGNSRLDVAWFDALAKALSAPSPRVQWNAGKAILRLRAGSPSIVSAATLALESHQNPLIMLRILALAKVVPPEVASLVRALAGGETPEGWSKIPPEARDAARALLAATASGP